MRIATPHVPQLFKEIIRNDAERAALQELSVIPFNAMAGLIREKRGYRRAAEKMLSWNKNKGTKK